jgi:hypothetical protein
MMERGKTRQKPCGSGVCLLHINLTGLDKIKPTKAAQIDG